MPSDSHFAIAMKSQKEAERAEQQRIKNLVLNYDLQDSNTDQAGTDDLYFDYFSHTNPNLPQRLSGFSSLTPLGENTCAHNDSSQGLSVDKHNAAHHQHNATLHQSSNHASPKPADKSGASRSGHRARKLQLSDVDWYDQKPKQPSDSLRGQGRGFPHRGSQRGRGRGIRTTS